MSNKGIFDPMKYKLLCERASICLSDEEMELLYNEYQWCMGQGSTSTKNAMKGRKEYYAFVEAQRDDVKFAVHTSPDGEPTIMSKKQFGDWAAGYTGGYLRVYPYLSLDDAMRDYGCTIATDDNGDKVILPILSLN